MPKPIGHTERMNKSSQLLSSAVALARQANKGANFMDMNKIAECDIFEMPTFPAPWSSEDAGDVFAMDDLLLVLQKAPLSVLAQTHVMNGEEPPSDIIISYLYAMPVYYKIRKEKLLKPILAVTLEQSNQLAMLKYIEDEDFRKEILAGNGKSEPMLCMFVPHRHLNFGPYNGPVNKEAIMELFLKILRDYLELPDNSEPVRIGNVAQVFEMLRA